MLRKTLIGLIAVATLNVFGMGGAQAQSLTNEVPILDCNIGDPAPENSCLLRLPASYKSRTVSASKANGDNYGSSWEFVDRDAFSGGKAFSGTMILVDITLGAGSGRVNLFNRREKQYIRDVINQLPDGESVAVYTFDTKIQKVSDFSTNHARALSAVDDLELTGIQTWIGANVLDAVAIMKRNKNFVMKSVIVVSDGLDESKVSADEVIKTAIAEKVSISAMGAFWRQSGHIDNGTGGAYLNKIAKRTRGEYAGITMQRAGADDAVKKFAKDIGSSRSESRLVALKEGEVAEPGKITVTVDRPVLGDEGEFEQVQFSAEFTPIGEPDITDEEEAPVPADPEPEPMSLVDTAIEWLKVNWYYAAAALLVLLILLILLLRRGSSDEDFDADASEFDDGEELLALDGDETEMSAVVDDAAGEDGPLTAPQRIVGYLYERTSGQRLPLIAGSTNVGRGSQNDIVIEDDSASRMHATLAFNGHGTFTVTDMSSTNGTYVNGTKIDRDQIARNGDTIRFGEYELILQVS